MHPWLQTPPGRYLLDWEQAVLDRAVVDVFGFHALQLGRPELDALQANRMPHRWLALDSEHDPGSVLAASFRADSAAPRGVALHCDFDALPFPNQSLDLVVLPHALELTRDPHHALREVERVLVPEGRLVIVGFNPASLWGLRQRWGSMCMRLGFGSLFLPRSGDFIGYWRLRDWLRLLSFEVESAHFGCYRPALRSQRWIDRFGWIEPIGERWWPVLGAVYFLSAVKRVRGMRMLGLARTKNAKPRAAPAVATNKHKEAN